MQRRRELNEIQRLQDTFRQIRQEEEDKIRQIETQGDLESVPNGYNTGKMGLDCQRIGRN